jgi:hypothetical protein
MNPLQCAGALLRYIAQHDPLPLSVSPNIRAAAYIGGIALAIIGITHTGVLPIEVSTDPRGYILGIGGIVSFAWFCRWFDAIEDRQRAENQYRNTPAVRAAVAETIRFPALPDELTSAGIPEVDAAEMYAQARRTMYDERGVR